MKKRTGERLEIAKAKENLWRQHRGQREMRTGDKEAWETLREKILKLEEEGAWREMGEETRMMNIMKARLQTPKDGVRTEVEKGMRIRDVMEAGDDRDGAVGEETKTVKTVEKNHDEVNGVKGVIENVRMAGRSNDEVGGVGDEMNAREVKEVRNAYGAYAEEGEMVKDVIEVEDECDGDGDEVRNEDEVRGDENMVKDVIEVMAQDA